MAGLTAARVLKGAGITPLILEAGPRVGGRIRTEELGGWPFDLGAAWIHGTTGNPVADLVARAGIETFITDFSDTVTYRSPGDPFDPRAVDRALEFFNARLQAADSHASVSAAVKPFLADAENPELVQWQIDFSGILGGDVPDELSVWAAIHDGFVEGDQAVFPRGLGQLVPYLQGDLEVRLNEPVNGIRWSSQGTTVVTSQAEYQADYVIVTVSVGVLQSGAIAFEPALPPQQQHALDNLRMGIADKALLRFPEAFWPTHQYFGPLDGNFALINLHAWTGQPWLLCFLGPPALGKSDAEIVGGILDALRQCCADPVPDPLETHLVRWSRDPLFGGSYSYVPTGCSPLEADLETPLGGRVYLAGEATHPKYPATLHGAYWEGERAAQAILAKVR